MKNLVLYHANCFDGMAAAWAAWKKLGDSAEYIPVNYNQPLPEDLQLVINSSIGPFDINCYILDFTYKRDILLVLKDRLKKLVVLDHHKTAEADLKGLDFCIFDMNKSGARLAWEYFFPDKYVDDDFAMREPPIPKLIQYVEDRDLWRFTLPHSHEINAFIQSYPMTIESYEHINFFMQSNLDDCIRQGIGIERYKNTMVETQARSYRIISIGGHWVPAVNSSILFSEVGNYLCKMNSKPDFVAYYVDRNDGMRQWGLRSIGEFDVSIIAKKYNGGGHKNAAGFITPQSYCGDI